jgi:hypothetical protein
VKSVRFRPVSIIISEGVEVWGEAVAMERGEMLIVGRSERPGVMVWRVW